MLNSVATFPTDYLSNTQPCPSSCFPSGPAVGGGSNQADMPRSPSSAQHEGSILHWKWEYWGLNETDLQGFKLLELFFKRFVPCVLRIFLDPPINGISQVDKALYESADDI